MHVNQQAREVVAARLAALGSLNEVRANGGADLLELDLPAAVIQTPSDVVKLMTKGWDGDGPLELRTIQLVVVLVVAGPADDLDDQLDAIRVDIEIALSDGNLGGIAKRLEHVRSELSVAHDEDGERWFAFLALTWEVDIWTVRGQPETPV